MRGIKFRAWDKDRKRMRGVVEITWFDDGDMRVNATETEKNYEPLLYMKEYQGKELQEFDLMRYIGKKDKNAKEIYEGDIIQGGGRKYIVTWDEKNTGFYGEMIGAKDSNYIAWEKFEIIGNIYENPELLKCD